MSCMYMHNTLYNYYYCYKYMYKVMYMYHHYLRNHRRFPDTFFGNLSRNPMYQDQRNVLYPYDRFPN